MKAEEKTAEQIINDLYWRRFSQTHCTFIESYGIHSAEHFNLIIEAMKEYAQSRTEALQKENEELARDIRNLLECQGVQKVTYEKLTEENDQLKQENERLRSLADRLSSGRDYLMGVNRKDLTIEAALESFGFDRNGFESALGGKETN